MRVVVVVIECLCTRAAIQTVGKCIKYTQQSADMRGRSQVTVAYLNDRKSPMNKHPIEPLRKEPMRIIVRESP